MGGKEGSSTTTMEIPEWLDSAMKEAVGGGLTDFNQFRQQGMDMIMPREGYTNVNAVNPWDIVNPGNNYNPDPGPPPNTSPGDGDPGTHVPGGGFDTGPQGGNRGGSRGEGGNAARTVRR